MNPTAVRLLATALCCFAGMVGQPAIAESAPAPSDILNPLGEPPIHLREPYVFTDAKKYFLFGTVSPAQGFQCYESPDLVHWKLDGWAWRMSGLRVARGELRAPQVFLYQGMYCMVYSARMANGNKLALAASVQPQGPYHDLHVPWLDLREDCTAGSVFVDDSGKAYLTFSQRDAREPAGMSMILGVALNQDLSKTVGRPLRLLQADQRWESTGKDQKRSLEAARIFKIGSKYYLTYCANEPRNSECAIGYATADKPLGPWTKSSDNPLLATRVEAGVLQPAQAAVFRSIDRKEWFLAYQTLCDSGSGASVDRSLNIDRLVLQGIRQLAIKSCARRASAPPALVK